MFYKIENEKEMIEDINRYKKMGMKSFSYHSVDGGWEVNFNLASIPLRVRVRQEEDK